MRVIGASDRCASELARAQCNTIRLKLLKIAARIRVTVRKAWIDLSSAYPHAQVFGQVYRNLQRASPTCTANVTADVRRLVPATENDHKY